MSEHDNDTNDPVQPAEHAPAEPAPAEPAAAQPVEAPKQRWRDRVFRMRAVAAVAVAGVILGAAGGSVTTALVSGDGHGDRDGHHRIGQHFQPGLPALPPGGRQDFPGQPGDGTQDDGTDDGTDEESDLSQS